MRRLLVLALVASGMGAGPPVAGSASPAPVAPACPARAQVQGLGTACLHPNGLYEVFGARGSLGFTHGPDAHAPAAAPETETQGPGPASAGPTIDIECVDGPYGDGQYAIQAFYARPRDNPDTYVDRVAPIRAQMALTAELLSDAAARSGAGGSVLRVRCVGGQVSVLNAVLNTKRGSADWSTVQDDMAALGYTDSRTKHLIFYDSEKGCACAGIANLYADDRPGPENSNNGNAAMYASTWGPARYWAMTHEMGHNLGAVQRSAPHSTNGYHCWDGLDIMCYNDGTARANKYTESICSAEVFDCRNDDYLSADPPAGSYLDTKWNIASPVNRFVTMTGGPAIGVQEPRARMVYRGCSILAGSTPTSAVFVERGCVRVTAADPSGVASVSVSFDNAVVGTLTQPGSDGIYEFVFEVQGPHPVDLEIEVIARGGDGIARRIRLYALPACCIFPVT